MANTATPSLTHDPDAKLDYGRNWATWLGTDTISTSTWSITKTTPAGDSSLVLSTSTHDATTTTIWADGGADGVNYFITNHIVTAAGREDDRTIVLNCRSR